MAAPPITTLGRLFSLLEFDGYERIAAIRYEGEEPIPIPSKMMVIDGSSLVIDRSAWSGDSKTFTVTEDLGDKLVVEYSSPETVSSDTFPRWRIHRGSTFLVWAVVNEKGELAVTGLDYCDVCVRVTDCVFDQLCSDCGRQLDLPRCCLACLEDSADRYCPECGGPPSGQ